MKLRRTRAILVAVACAGIFGVVRAGDSTGRLIKDASLRRSEAETIALTKVPKGRIKTAELEKENGRLVWSFDIARPGTRNITEVHVDAKNGEIVSVTTETPAQEAAEARSDKAKR